MASDETTVCGDCGLEKAPRRHDAREQPDRFCGAHLAGSNCGYVLPVPEFILACQRRTIDRLRPAADFLRDHGVVIREGLRTLEEEARSSMVGLTLPRTLAALETFDALTSATDGAGGGGTGT